MYCIDYGRKMVSSTGPGALTVHLWLISIVAALPMRECFQCLNCNEFGLMIVIWLIISKYLKMTKAIQIIQLENCKKMI